MLLPLALPDAAQYRKTVGVNSNYPQKRSSSLKRTRYGSTPIPQLLQGHRLTHAGIRIYMGLHPATTSANTMLLPARHYIGTMADEPCYRQPQTLGGAAIIP